MDMKSEEKRNILPASGIWTVEDLARWLGMEPSVLQQRLSDREIKTIRLSSRFSQRLIRLEDIK